MANLLSQLWGEILYVLGFRSTVLEYIPPPRSFVCFFPLVLFSLLLSAGKNGDIASSAAQERGKRKEEKVEKISSHKKRRGEEKGGRRRRNGEKKKWKYTKSNNYDVVQNVFVFLRVFIVVRRFVGFFPPRKMNPAAFV